MNPGIAAGLTLLIMAAGAETTIDPGLARAAKGRAIAVESARRDEGFGDTVVDLTMTLRNSEGRERIRRLTWRTLEVDAPGAGDRSVTLFHEPRDIAGTVFLSHTYIDRDDDQWLYLPALKRVKRIAAGNRAGAFVGSEFTYEDLLADEVERFDYRWLRDESCGTASCFVVERQPRYGNSGYSRQIVWLDQQKFIPVRIEYFDRRGRHQKTLLLEEYRLYLDRYWRAHRLIMESYETGKTTVLDFDGFRFRTGLTEREFDPSTLRLSR